jgi:hypothetical protein
MFVSQNGNRDKGYPLAGADSGRIEVPNSAVIG